MKNISTIIPYMLLSIGTFYFLQTFNYLKLQAENHWQMLLLFFGISFLITARTEREASYFLPGIALSGIGLHFLLLQHYSVWPDTIPAFILIIALSLFALGKGRKNGYFPGVVVLAVGLFIHFYEQVINSFSFIQPYRAYFDKYWPILLIVTAFYLLFIKRK
ncbi:LiaF transmembrane domain-containing protein [Metabacillus arenae]|uniref:LiaF transmembrane domain-containing protein n=1 Tax=Metabacillus arenae TaxID=2771434 RepID=A0A926RYH2_9BACI|nr:hypothetical protein [Metabacillus arenae]MBD1381182.1 hypothetical protein [Metabacillus arenae]